MENIENIKLGTVRTQMSSRKYNLLIGCFLLYGFLANLILIATLGERILSWNLLAVIIMYFISCVTGVILFTRSDQPLISFIGYSLIVIPVGILLTLCLKGVDPSLVFRAVGMTACVTVLMIILASVYPNVFLSMGKALFAALLGAIVVEMVMIFVFHAHPGFLDWAVALIFCGYIGYDWAVANRKERTLDAAIDGAAALYLDIINLFIRILSILNRK